MKTVLVVAISFVALACFQATAFAAEETRTVTGKVADVDPQGKAIVVDVGSGETSLNVGAIVQPETKLMAAGKSVPVSELPNAIKPGDTVTMKYEKSDDLYAKQITKK